jgi:hypothetical protein
LPLLDLLLGFALGILIYGLRLAMFGCAVISLCALTMFTAFGLAYIATAILFVGEFVMRRIAESPKGPVLALSGLFGGVAALIQVFG